MIDWASLRSSANHRQEHTSCDIIDQSGRNTQVLFLANACNLHIKWVESPCSFSQLYWSIKCCFPQQQCQKYTQLQCLEKRSPSPWQRLPCFNGIIIMIIPQSPGALSCKILIFGEIIKSLLTLLVQKQILIHNFNSIFIKTI